MSAAPSLRLRAAGRIAWGLALLALAAGTMVCRRDRAHAWETPRWDPAEFVVLRSAPTAPARETWAVAFQPRCAHCREALVRIVADAGRSSARPQVAVLVIDAPRADAEAVARGHRGVVVLWDARGVWRTRWGHRLYGEILRFAADGTYRGVLD